MRRRLWRDRSPALGALTVPLCARGSETALQPVEVEGPGLLSMATSDTTVTQICSSVKINDDIKGALINRHRLCRWDLHDYNSDKTGNQASRELTVHIRVHVFSFSSCTRPLDLWLDDKRALFPGQVHFMLHRHAVIWDHPFTKAQGHELFKWQQYIRFGAGK